MGPGSLAVVLVVVHQQQAVGVVGDELQIPVGVADGRVDVEAQVAGMEVVVECGEESAEAGLRLGGDLLEVDGEAAIAGVGGEKGIDLLDEIGARASLVRKSPISGIDVPCLGS